MGKQILFCVETTRNAKTDSVYIDETIKRFYKITNGIRKRYIYLGGKNNYNKTSIRKDIEKQTKQYKPNGGTTVIYCIDTDKHDSDPEQKRELEKIILFCQDMGYEFVWFCRDVEDVYWGEQIPKDEKTRKAAQFRSGNRINDIPEASLCRKEYVRHYSNILEVLDKHLNRC